jgi:glutathione S-transferase
VVILEKGLQDIIELVSVMPADNPSSLLTVNPLGTVPALQLADGSSLCESPIICEYLDSLSPQNPLFPSENSTKFKTLELACLADGIMDAAVTCVMEARRPEEKRYEAIIKRKEMAILRAVEAISQQNISESNWDIGSINTAIALEYIIFRLPHLNWQADNPNLEKWLEIVNKNASMLATKPIL